MSSAHVMRWSAAMENWHRIHYDLPFAREHDKLPGLVINGSWKQHFIVQTIRRWAEPEGWLYKVSFQFRAMNVVGSTLTSWAEITDLSERDGFGWVGLKLGIIDDQDVESTPGTALVVLPLSADRPVPYPFPAA
jgi:hydroxyacyl-ACP dehydratase HTD2-like protein with hotdog domain